ncbi:serine hydrolase domain-containing protein [Nocardioides sp.]|uniref:serine hydrolase domain-containing protein n=1 Tax=Nocardioides sp. TaxID=35761 RepID=UPI002D7E755B|nr:serine hydrolase domain-containing protein [Nocardioides sp.]HET8959095.1 serine hydrolase domain-containing protein [Nocardioides sp.]
MTSLATSVDQVAESTGFSGVVRVDVGDEVVLERAYGLADRARGIPMAPDTRIGVASGGKTFTALAVLRLVEEGALSLDTRARDLLGADLPLIDDGVTVEHLLSHRSGIGDYLDEDEIEDGTDYLMAVPVHRLDSAGSYLEVLDGYPQRFPPGTGFVYCNGAYCVLAILAERASGTTYHDLVRTQVLQRAGLTRTDFLRSDELPGDAAWGYLRTDGLRTNVLHLPVVGGGDGGIFTTAGDVAALWAALDAGRVVSCETYTDMVRPRSEAQADGRTYGLGFWLRDDWVSASGYDAGASFRSMHRPGLTWSVLSNTTEGTWAMAPPLEELLVGNEAAR